MGNRFVAMVYAYLKDHNIDTSGMTTQEAIDKFEEMEDDVEAVPVNSLTNQEWAIYYKRIGDEQHGDYIYHFTEEHVRCVYVENKVIIDNGRFRKPKVTKILIFQDNDEMNDFLKEAFSEGEIE